MTSDENLGSRMRTWQEETEMLLSLLNCVVLEHEAVYASTEFFTGQRYYDLCLKNEARTPEDLQQKLGAEYKNRLLAKNKEHGMHFARKLYGLGHKIVLTPVAFNADPLNLERNWSGGEYTGFWNLVIDKKCHTVYLNEGWQFSDSCVFDYLAGLKAGNKLLDHAGNSVVLAAARKMVSSAVGRLEDFGFAVPKLHQALTELKTFSSLG
jgi:hypothetical protein